MAHVLKIKAPSVSPLVDHYERARPGTFDRSNIDRSRTHQNYNLAPCDVKGEVRMAMAEHERTAGRAVRSDANVLFDWVVTLPQDCPTESAREFFSGVLEFIQGRYGEGNVLGAYVHMDETTPHMHVPVLPMIDGKLQASKMITRNDLMRFHGELGEFMDDRLGFHVSIELDEEKHAQKAMSKLDQNELRLAAKRLEDLQRAEVETRTRIGELEDAISVERDRIIGEDYAKEAFYGGDELGKIEEEGRAYAAQARSLGARADGVAAHVQRLRERVDELRSAVADARRGAIDLIPSKLRETIQQRIERMQMIASNAERHLRDVDVVRSVVRGHMR